MGEKSSSQDLRIDEILDYIEQKYPIGGAKQNDLRNNAMQWRELLDVQIYR